MVDMTFKEPVVPESCLHLYYTHTYTIRMSSSNNHRYNL